MSGAQASFDEPTASRVRRLLAGKRPVERKMMGGLAFMVNGAMCCSVGRDGVLVRVTPEERDTLLAKPHVTPMKLGRRVMAGFLRVGLEGVRTDAALTKWLARGLDAAKQST